MIFTTDHGEYMGEHGLLGKNNLYESVYHLPLVMHLPGKAETGVRSSTYLDVVDFGVTLSGLAGIDYPFAVHGTDKSEDLLKGEAHYQRELYIHPSDVPRAGIMTEDYELAYVGRGNTGGVFHDHVLYSIDRADLNIRLETIDILVVCMEDLHQVPVGVGIIFPENQPVAVQILEIDGLAGQRMLR